MSGMSALAAKSFASCSCPLVSMSGASRNNAFGPCNKRWAASWKKVNQKWSSERYRKLSNKSALSGDTNRVAPLARHPAGARRTTTATPQSPQILVSSGMKRVGSFCLVKGRIVGRAPKNRSESHILQEMLRPASSPCRSHAATAPGCESNVADVLKAANSRGTP